MDNQDAKLHLYAAAVTALTITAKSQQSMDPDSIAARAELIAEAAFRKWQCMQKDMLMNKTGTY